jgi:hypothetical protein
VALPVRLEASGTLVAAPEAEALRGYLIASSLSIAPVKPDGETGMVTGLHVTDFMPMLRLVPAFIAVMSSGVSGTAAYCAILVAGLDGNRFLLSAVDLVGGARGQEQAMWQRQQHGQSAIGFLATDGHGEHPLARFSVSCVN